MRGSQGATTTKPSHWNSNYQNHNLVKENYQVLSQGLFFSSRTQNKGMTPHKVSNHQFRPTHVKKMFLTAEITSLNCDETICPSIYVPNQMHHMLFQCIVDLWGLLLFSCTIAQVIRPRKFPNHQFRPCLPAARKSGCQLVQLEQIYWFQRYPKSKCVLIFYYPIIAVDLWRNHLSQHVPACAYLGITLPGHGLALCV